MTEDRPATDTLENLTQHVPFLRRYGRALAGNQTDGDGVAAATLSCILSSPQALAPDVDPKVALFRVFQSMWSERQTIGGADSKPLAQAAQRHLSALDLAPRNALLLKGLEQFSVEEIAQIMEIGTPDVRALLDSAYTGMAESMAGRILIIEDDSFIANEIETLVTDMGHMVTGNASTKASAVALAKEDEPDLILADVVLADQTSGIDAAEEIVAHYTEKPVIEQLPPA